MLVMKQFAMTLMEIVSEALLIGILFVLLVVPTQEISSGVILVSALPVIVVLFLYGYYFTRPILGILWKRDLPIAYGACASALYLIQMYIAFARLKPDMRSEAASKALPLLLGGAAIVFVCAVIGRLLLRRWRRRTFGPSASDG